MTDAANLATNVVSLEVTNAAKATCVDEEIVEKCAAVIITNTALKNPKKGFKKSRHLLIISSL